MGLEKTDYNKVDIVSIENTYVPSKIIETERLKELLCKEMLLEALSRGGVEGWSWHDVAIAEWEKTNNKKIGDVEEQLDSFHTL